MMLVAERPGSVIVPFWKLRSEGPVGEIRMLFIERRGCTRAFIQSEHYEGVVINIEGR